MNNTTTALTDLIAFTEQLDTMPETNLGFTTADQWVKWASAMIRTKAIDLLQKDREDIQNAYEQGAKDHNKGRMKHPADYFNQSFTQYKTETNG